MTSTFKPSPDGHLHITIAGDLIGGADTIKFMVDLRDTLAERKFSRVEIDASGAGFVNSSGLGMLIAARQAAQEHGAEFRLDGAAEQLRHLLEITKLTEILGAV